MSSKNIKAGRLLSKFIRQIAEEETEFVKGKGSEDDRMLTKAEALARKMWRLALGYDEIVVTDEGSKTIVHLPDLKMAAIIMDRLEGRCGTVQEDEVTRPNTASKITEQGQKRIAAIGGFEDDEKDSA
jgi:hypothetical protein